MASKKTASIEYKVINQEANANLKEIGKNVKTLNKEFNLQKEQMKTASSESEKLDAELSKLNKEYDLSQQKTQTVADGLKKVKEATGENSNETRIWNDKLLDAQKNEEFLKNKIDATTTKLKEATQAEKGMTEEQRKSIEASEKRKAKLDELGSSQDRLKGSSEKLTKEYELQVAELGNNAKESDKAQLKQKLLADQMKNSADQVKNLEQQLSVAKSEFGANSQEVDKLEKELLDAKLAGQQFANEFKDSTNKLKNFGDKVSSIGNSMKNLGKGMSMYVTAPIVAGVGLSVKAASDFDSAFTGVKKTVDELKDTNGKTIISYKDLEKGIREMATTIPASTTEISEVAEAAGQLGIKTDSVLSFTRTMIDMGESTNLSSNDAATALARLANITQMPQNEFDRLGSTIVALGNNLATTESEITEMGLRLAGAGKQVGMSEAEIVSFAGALSSVGIEAEAGGSAFSKVMINMQLATEKGTGAFTDLEERANKAGLKIGQIGEAVLKGGKGLDGMAKKMDMTSSQLRKIYKEADKSQTSLEQFANVAGMSANDFAKAFKEDAAGAIIKFIEGLGKAEEHGTSAIKVLDDMEITEVRLRDSLLRAAGAGDVFSDAIKLGTDAWDENTALTDEATKRYETFESKLQLVKNKLNEIGIEMGGPLMDALGSMLDALDPVFKAITGIAKAFSGASPAMQKFIMIMVAAVAAIGPLLVVAGSLMTLVGSIMTAFGVGVSVAVGAIAIIPIIIIAIVALVAAIVVNWDKIKKATSNLVQGISEKWNAFVTYMSQLWASIKQTASVMWAEFSEWFMNKIISIILPILVKWELLKLGMSLIWQAIKVHAEELWNSLVTAIGAIMQGIISAIMVPVSIVQTLLEAAWLLIQAGVTIAWEAIKIATKAAWDLIKQYIVDPVTQAWNWVTAKFTELGVWLGTKWAEIKAYASAAWAVIKDSIINPIIEAKNNAVNTIQEMYSNIVAKFDSIKQTTMEKFNAVKEFILSPIRTARDTLKGWIDDIKGFFNNLKLKIPTPTMPKLPHFSLKTSTKSILGKEITFPSGINVDWYAKGGIFTKPTIFGGNGNSFKGAGEAGPEAALPLNANTLGSIGQGIENQMFNGDFKSMMNEFINNLSRNTTPIELVVYPQLDGKTIGEASASIVDGVFVEKSSNLGIGTGRRTR
ncbi:phage tail tape measure protein [Carnobacterium divergens]|uniref:phage tail tape measure protein n=1 Tax=Carnobacterium divergens TaxID=2748 RepID=UPI0035D7C2C6